MKTRSGRFLVFLAALSTCVPLQLAAQVKLSPTTVVSFASVEEGRRLLTTTDDFVAALSPYDRAFRMKAKEAVSEKEYLAFVGTNMVAWTAEETNQFASILQGLSNRLAALPFPPTVLLIKTTGLEEANFSYTRQNAVIIPEREAHSRRSNLEYLITHELFHVLSRHDSALRTRLYGIIGFTRIGEVQLPEEILQRKVTNPDGVENGWLISVTNDHRVVPVAPVLCVPRPDYDLAKSGNTADLFRLLALTNAAGHWAPRLEQGHPQLFAIREVTGFYEQVGRNTSYVIHPDEILADNFAHLIRGRTNLPTPRIIAEMKKALWAEDK